MARLTHETRLWGPRTYGAIRDAQAQESSGFPPVDKENLFFGQNSVGLEASAGCAEDFRADRMGGDQVAPEQGAGFPRRDVAGQARVKRNGVALGHDDMEPRAEQRFEALVEGGADDQ